MKPIATVQGSKFIAALIEAGIVPTECAELTLTAIAGTVLQLTWKMFVTVEQDEQLAAAVRASGPELKYADLKAVIMRHDLPGQESQYEVIHERVVDDPERPVGR